MGSRGHACLGFALDLRRIVSVCLGCGLRSRLFKLLELLQLLDMRSPLQLMLGLQRGIRTDLLNLHRRLRTSLLDVRQLRSVDLLKLLGRARCKPNVV